MAKSGDPKLNEWHLIIKLFYQTYDKVMKVYISQPACLIFRDNQGKKLKVKPGRDSIIR